MSDPFESVLDAAKAGADWAWERLFLDLAGPIRGYFASRGAPDPEDLTSETFLHLARGIHSFEGDAGSFRSWAFVIAHRRMIDARRSASRNVVTVPKAQSEEPSGGDVEEEALRQLSTAETIKALRVLTDEQREVLVLRVIADLSLDETAKVVGKSVGAVKAMQRRALETLRKKLGEEVSKSRNSTIT